MSSLATTPPVAVGASSQQARRASASATPCQAASIPRSLSSKSARGPGPAHFASGSLSNNGGQRPPALVVADAAPATTTVGFAAPVPVGASSSAAGHAAAALASPQGANGSRGLLSSALEGGGGAAAGGGALSASLGRAPSSLLSPKQSLFADPTGASSRVLREEAAALEAAIAAAAAADATATATAEEAAATRTVDLLADDDATTTTTNANNNSRTDDEDSDTPEALLAAAQRRHDVFRAPGVAAALRLAARLHASAPPRASGEPLIAHCVAVATILAELGLGEDLVAAGLLHDALGPRSSLLSSAAAPAAPAAATPQRGARLTPCCGRCRCRSGCRS